ncbi:MAG: hypothetical protein H6557_16590 [Lewinellaceae bacterium]|nr:hypothetical protein [Phaeodactylibacter sp.]MCB9038234.1 hypothetical protein [Lewinellaceae bacterium]MCB9300978.1 hypothetical protein [Lewinellaceae bacterium]
MTKDLDSRKYKLIQEIMKLDNEEALSKLEEEVESIQQEEVFWTAIKPLRKTLTLEQMIKEQNYKPIEKDEFFKMVDELEIEESIEELLSMLD